VSCANTESSEHGACKSRGGRSPPLSSSDMVSPFGQKGPESARGE
jgi:hypothetical protein